MKTQIICLCLGWFLSLHDSISQPVAVSPATDAVREYFDEAASFSPLYFGKAAHDYGRQLEYPYFVSPDFVPGRIRYDGIDYNNVMLRLDLSRNELCVLPPGGFVGVVLTPDLVGGAFMHDCKIVPVFRKDVAPFAEEKKYLVEFFNNGDGTLRGLCSTVKKKVESNTGGVVSLSYLTNKKYFIDDNGRFVEIRRKRDLNNYFPEKRKEMEQYMKSLGLRYSDDPALYIGRFLKQVNNK